MLNQIILVGRLVKEPEIIKTENEKSKCNITLAVNRGYKNSEGVYDTDFFDITLWTGVAENTSEYCKKGDVIVVKGRLQTKLIDKDDGTKYKKIDIIGDKVTFLSTRESQKNKDDMER